MIHGPRICNAPLVCGSPYEKSYGNLLVKPDLEKARQLLKESGYDGTPIVMMHATDLLSSNQLPPVGKQALEKIGFPTALIIMTILRMWEPLAVTLIAEVMADAPPELAGAE